MFGKTIQNNREQKDICLVNNERTRDRITTLVNSKGNKCIPDFLQIFEMEINQLKMDLLILVGNKF